MRIVRFEWDEDNESRIGLHRVDPEEAEEVLRGPHVVQRGPFKRWLAWGRTAVGRHLLVVFVLRDGVARVVTARDTSAGEKKRFRRRLRQ